MYAILQSDGHGHSLVTMHVETVATIGAVTCCPINNGPKS